MSDIYPPLGAGHPLPSQVHVADSFAVLEYEPGPDYEAGNGWTLACFVVGAASRNDARDEAAIWLGRPARLLATKVGGTAGKLEVVGRESPPPPLLTVRDWDPAVDE